MATKEYKIHDNTFYVVSDKGYYDAENTSSYKPLKEQIKYRSPKGELSVHINEGETGIGPSGIGGDVYTWVAVYHKKPMELLSQKVKSKLGFGSKSELFGECKFSQQFDCDKKTFFESFDKLMPANKPEIKQFVAKAYDLMISKGRPTRINDLSDIQQQNKESMLRQQQEKTAKKSSEHQNPIATIKSFFAKSNGK